MSFKFKVRTGEEHFSVCKNFFLKVNRIMFDRSVSRNLALAKELEALT